MGKKIRRLLFSDLMVNSPKTLTIAYVAVMTAICVVCNMFFEFKFASVQFSLTIFISALTGIIIGPLFGFVACFLGDLLGFITNSGGFMYMPWIGISMGLVALFTGFIMNGINLKFKGGNYVKIFFVCIITFAVCTVAINTTAFWILYADMKVPYDVYLVSRLFVQGQIWNSLLNYGLLFACYPLIAHITAIIVRRKNR